MHEARDEERSVELDVGREDAAGLTAKHTSCKEFAMG
jgi:hypothetical protein